MLQKQLILCIVTLVGCFNCYAQTFAPVGSVWHYENSRGKPFSNYDKYESVLDTSFLGFNAQKINTDIYIAQLNDTVFIYRKDLNQFVKFFYYGGNVGDSLYLDAPVKDEFGPEAYTIGITEVNTLFIDGKNRRSYKFDGGPSFGHEFIEGIGFTPVFFPFWGAIATDYSFGLRCFNGETVEDRYKDIACDAGDSVNVKEPIQRQPVFSIYPNPANSELTFSVHKSVSIQVFNLVGLQVMTVDAPSGISTIDISELKNGIYFLKIPGKQTSQRLVKL